MKIDFSGYKLTLVLVSQDMRCGYNKLASLASEHFHIDVSKMEDAVVFVSKNRRMVKIIMHDRYGSLLIVRRLDERKFQQLMTRVDGSAREIITVSELERYLDGEALVVKRSNPYYG